MAKYLVQDTELTSVADAIRARGGTSEQLAFPGGFVSAVEGIQAGGVNLFQYATSLEGTFNNATGMTEISVVAPNADSIRTAFQNSAFSKIALLVTSVCTNAETAFTGAKAAEIDLMESDTSHITNFRFCFWKAENLVQILGRLDLSAATSVSHMFTTANVLRSVAFVEDTIPLNIAFDYCPELTNDSIVSIANGLRGGVSNTLTLHTTSKACCNEIFGTVSAVTDGGSTYDFFTQDESGTVTLTEFITNTKGWTLA